MAALALTIALWMVLEALRDTVLALPDEDDSPRTKP
jgi:hypothetical protein